MNIFVFKFKWEEAPAIIDTLLHGLETGSIRRSMLVSISVISPYL